MLPLNLENLLKVVRVELHTHTDPFDYSRHPEEWETLHLFTDSREGEDKDGQREDSEIKLSHNFVIGTGLSAGYVLQVLQAIVGFKFTKQQKPPVTPSASEGGVTWFPIEEPKVRIYTRSLEPIPKVEASPRFLPLTLENIQKVVEIRIVKDDAVGLFLNTCERGLRSMFPTPRLSPSVTSTSVEIDHFPCPLGYVEELVEAAAGKKFLLAPKSDPYLSIMRREDHLEATTEDSGCLNDDQIQRYVRTYLAYTPGAELPLDCLDYGPMDEHITYKCEACRDNVYAVIRRQENGRRRRR